MPRTDLWRRLVLLSTVEPVTVRHIDDWAHGRPGPGQSPAHYRCGTVTAQATGAASAAQQEFVLYFKIRLEMMMCHNDDWVLMIWAMTVWFIRALLCLHNFNFETSFKSKWIDSNLSEVSHWPLHQAWSRTTCLSPYLHWRTISSINMTSIRQNSLQDMQKDERAFAWHFSFRLAISQHQTKRWTSHE